MRSRRALVALLTPPMLWLVVAYLGARAVIFATAFWTTDPFTNLVVRTFTLENFRELLTPTYLGIIGRTLLIAAILVPLWASYLVKAYAWRTMLQPGGVLDSAFGATPGYGFAAVVLTLTYLWLPYMILPVYAAFERLPESHLEASADLGGRPGATFRRVVVPSLLPAIAAGSVFTFSLSLGDYIAVQIVGGKLQVLGTTVLQ